MPGIITTLKNNLLSTEYMVPGIDDKVSEETLDQIQNDFHLYWTNILDQMIYLFTETNIDECSKKDELKDEELDKYCEEKRKEALEMFNKYFNCLWY